MFGQLLWVKSISCFGSTQKLDTVAEDLYSTGQELSELLVNSIDGTPVAELQTLHAPIPNWREVIATDGSAEQLIST